MSDIIDLGGAPANEDCAQLGQSPDFERLNRLEVAAYRAAIIALHGSPPEGCSLVTIANPHDFGTYRTLGLRIEDHAAGSEAAKHYAALVEDGLAHWIEACFAAPVRYPEGSDPVVDRHRIEDIVTGVIMATRPDKDGRFFVPDFATCHHNLAAAFPASAEAAHLILQEMPS